MSKFVSQDGRGDLLFNSKNAQNYLKSTGDVGDDFAPSIVVSRALAIEAEMNFYSISRQNSKKLSN